VTVLPHTVAPARPGVPWLAVVRGAGAAAVSALLGIGGPLALGIAAFLLLPTCAYDTSPPALLGLAGGALLLAAVAPVLVAGRRLWWVGVPAAALAVHGLMPMAWSLLTESQSGFCF
jgi:hypothetical protein